MSDNPLAPPGESPLAEADPASVEIFMRERVDTIMDQKPLDTSDAQLAVLIEYWRKRRQQFLIDSQTKAPRAAPKRSAGGVSSVADGLAKSKAKMSAKEAIDLL